MKNFIKQKLSVDKLVQNSKFDYCKNLKWFLLAPICIILVGIIIFASIGFNLGIEFTGGSMTTIYANDKGVVAGNSDYKYNLDKSADLSKFKNEIKEVLKDCGINTNNVIFQETQMTIESLSITDGQGLIVKYQNVEGGETGSDAVKNQEIKDALLAKFGCTDSSLSDIVSLGTTMSASASSELLTNSLLAMLVAIVLVLVYVIFRFEVVSGLSAVLALFHDLLIMISVVLIFRVTINASFIAGLVTILGYSINNTIIIFDRIRENLRSGVYEKASNSQIANISVKETMTRSVFTTITTFITISLVAIIGVADIRAFAFPIAVGVLAGFYSSVFITPGLWAIAFKGSKSKKVKIKKEIVEA